MSSDTTHSRLHQTAVVQTTQQHVLSAQPLHLQHMFTCDDLSSTCGKSSPALTEDTAREPSRSSSAAAAHKPGFSILLLLPTSLHILRGPSTASREPASRPVPEGGTCCAGDEGHLNLQDAAAEAPERAEQAGGCGVEEESGAERLDTVLGVSRAA